MLGKKNKVKNEVEKLQKYEEKEKRIMGKGNLECVSLEGGREFKRRKKML